MKTIKEIFRSPVVNINGNTIHREAVRAIIINNGKLLMIRSAVNKDYKFPGGGVEKHETNEDTLTREVMEECGATVTRIISAYGKVIEYGISPDPDYETFKMTSYYYLCEVNPTLAAQQLEKEEIDLEFEPTWTDVDTAIYSNKSVLQSAQPDKPKWIERETYVLEQIKSDLLL